MSDSSGKPVSSFTSRRIFNPSSSPGPRNDSIDDRLALSNDDLNTRLIRSSSRIFSSVRAIVNACSRDSITHGPAMKRGGLPAPKTMSSVMRMARVVMRRALYSRLVKSRRGRRRALDDLDAFHREVVRPDLEELRDEIKGVRGEMVTRG